jgi:hypothetical protein
MPGGDRTGSMGQGPRTGRGLGYCSGFDSPGFSGGTGYGMGRGFGSGRGMHYGRGMGGGRGFGRGRGIGAFNTGPMPGYPWMQSMSKEDEITMLKSQSDALSRSQKDIEKRLAELEKE